MADTDKVDELRDDPGKVPLYLSPYEVWNFGPGKGYAFPGIRKFFRYISALAELPSNQTRLQELGKLKPGARLPTVWRQAGLTFVPFVAEKPFDHEIRDADELAELLRNALQEVLVDFIEPLLVDIKRARFRVAFPVPDAALNQSFDQAAMPDWTPDGGLRERIGQKRITVMAVIDDGLPFAHRHFRDATGRRSRVEFCWLQSAVADQAQHSVLFGREYTRNRIEDYIAQYGDDEDTLYREAGARADAEEFGCLIDRHATHGSHVMDLATGYGAERGEDPAEEIRIIAVQLPNTIALDTSGFGKDMYMLSAFHYIFNRADLIAERYGVEKLRVVINFSYGFSGGRHDGNTELEAAINQLIATRRQRRGPTALVVPAANTFLDSLHGMVRPTDFHDGEARLPWRIQPNDRTPSYLELWFPQTANPIGYAIELLDPQARLLSHLSIDTDTSNIKGGDPVNFAPLLNGDGHQIGQLSADLHRADAVGSLHSTGRWRVLVVMAPTEPDDERLPGAPCGEWTVVIRRGATATALDHPIHCWIQRASDPESLRSGSRQSYFDDPRDVRYDPDGDLAEVDSEGALVRRFGTLNGLATGGTSLIVAGYRLGAGLGSNLGKARPARYSGAGALEPGWPEAKVACSSMSDRSRVLPGTIAAGVRSGALSLVQGTSTAAPFVARQLAAAFVTADDGHVESAAAENYRSLLSGHSDPLEGDDLTKDRLGTVRVPPHWQPGLDVDLLT